MDSMETLTKANLAKHLMEELEFSRKDAEILVNTFLKCMVDSLRKGHGIELRGFGSLCLRDRRARQGRNPKSGQSIKVPAKRVICFKLGKFLKNKLIDDSTV